MDLTCPKCGAVMRPYERNGVTIEQCSECRGVFLDRGELERLIDAEAAYAAAPVPADARWGADDDDDERRHTDPRFDRRGGRRRRGFLGDLFDFD
jgi:Zn-finger nucleic acid-binding protein